MVCDAGRFEATVVIMRALLVGTFVSILGGAVGCGGDEGEPFLSGSMTGEYDGTSFTPEFGFATPFQSGAIIGVGDGNVACGTEDDNAPPEGRNAIISVPALEVGSYSSAFVQMFENVDSFEGVGSNSGSVEITQVTADTVTGSVDYDYTDDESRHFSLSGTFEVVNCSP